MRLTALALLCAMPVAAATAQSDSDVSPPPEEVTAEQIIADVIWQERRDSVSGPA
jgi:hypothetical protein